MLYGLTFFGPVLRFAAVAKSMTYIKSATRLAVTATSVSQINLTNSYRAFSTEDTCATIEERVMNVCKDYMKNDGDKVCLIYVFYFHRLSSILISLRT